MSNNKETYHQNPDEISPKEILLKVHEYLSFFWLKKWYIIVPIILFVGLFIYKSFTAPRIYMGETKFFLEGKEGSGGGALGGLLGQIGVGGNKTNPYQIIEVAESKLHMADILFERMGKDSVLIANKILEEYDLPNEWGKDNEKYIGFTFSHDSIDGFNSLENSVLIRLIHRIIDNSKNEALMITDFDDDKGFYYIQVLTTNHDLSMRLSEISYEKLRIYFEEKTRENLKHTRNLLRIKSDSIKALLDTKIRQLADYKDRNRSVIYNSAQVREILLESELQGLNSAYMEVLKSYEMADYKYLDQKNYFMLIDKPRRPLRFIFPNWKIQAIKGGFLGLFLSLGFLFMFKLYRDIMNS